MPRHALSPKQKILKAFSELSPADRSVVLDILDGIHKYCLREEAKPNGKQLPLKAGD